MSVLKGIGDPSRLEKTEQPLQTLLNTVLTESFKQNNASRKITEALLEYLDELDQDSDLLSAWQRPSFYEWIVPRFQEDEPEFFASAKDLFVALFRSNKE